MKINAGNYENITVSMGGSIDAKHPTIRSMSIMREKLRADTDEALADAVSSIRAALQESQSGLYS